MIAPVDERRYSADMRRIAQTVDDLARRVRQLEACELPAGGGVAAHNILDGGAVHLDAALDAVSAGSLIYGNATPEWDELDHPGAQYRYLQAGAALPGWVASIPLDDDSYVGVPAGGRLVFDSTPNPDQVEVTSADLNFVTANHGIIHVDGVAAGMYLRADGTRYVPNTIQDADIAHDILDGSVHSDSVAQAVTRGSLIYGNATPAWDELNHPAAAGYALTTDANDVLWDQTPTWTGEHTFAAGLEVSDDQDLTFGDGDDATIRYDEAGDNRMEVSGADWWWNIDVFWITSSTSTQPDLRVENTNEDALAPVLEFYKNSVSPADDDDLGAVDFYGETSTSAKERYAAIWGESLDVTNGDTGGGLRFMVVMDAVERDLLTIAGYNGAVNQGSVTVNDEGQDVDFTVEAVGVADALVVQGSDGQFTVGALGAGFVRSDAAGVLSSSALVAGDLPAHTHSGAAQGGSLVIGTTDTDATAGSVLFAGVAGVIQEDNAGLFWDDGNDRLGINDNTPDAPLDVYHVTVDIVAFFESGDDIGGIEVKDNDTTGYLYAADGYIYVGGDAAKAVTNLMVDDGTGNVGIGGVPLSYIHLRVTDTTLTSAATYYGIQSYHTKTGGAGLATDDYYGIYSYLRLNQATTCDDWVAIYGEVELDAGTVDQLIGIWSFVDIDAGAVSTNTLGADIYVLNSGTATLDDVYGVSVRVDMDSGTAVNGNVYGVYIMVDDDIGVAGAVYTLFLNGLTDVDYCIYQNDTSYNYLQGYTGIGIDPTGLNTHLYVYDNSLTSTATFYGIRSYHIKDGGVGNPADDYFGIYSYMGLNQATTIDNLYGIYGHGIVSAGTADIVWGAGFLAELDGGTLNISLRGFSATARVDGGTVPDVYGGYIYVDINAGTVGDDVFGLYIFVNDAVGAAGTVSMLVLDDGGGAGVDYGLYQTGSADNYFAGYLGINDTTPDASLDVQTSNAVTATYTDVAILAHDTSGTAAVGFGTALLYQMEDAGGILRDAGRLSFEWEVAAAATRRSRFVVYTCQTAGTIIENGVVEGTTSATVAGNSRGAGAVDWQAVRSAATEVASGNHSVICGGYNNTADNAAAIVAGGSDNRAGGGTHTAVCGGYTNDATGDYSICTGGNTNAASGNYGATLGGWSNLASGTYTVAAGYDAHATHNNSMVFSATAAQTLSWAVQTFTVRCHGGARFYSAAGVGTGVQLSAGGNAWAAISDKAVKRDLVPVEGILEKLDMVPVYEYSLKSQDPSVRHVGPVAQEFNPTFGFTEDPIRINMLDISSVALAGVKELHEKIKQQAAEISRLKTRVAVLEGWVV